MKNAEINNSIDDREATYDHVLKYTGLFGGVQGFSMLISLVRNKLVALLLGPEGIALINIFNNVMKLINESTNFGVSFSAVKHIAELGDVEDNRDETVHYISIVRTWSLVTGLFGALLTLAFSPIISNVTFSTYEYTADFALLSPMVAALSITGGELAILKGLKRLKYVAVISIIAAVATLFICIPLYWAMNLKGVALSLSLSTMAAMAVHLRFSCRIVPWHTSLFSKSSYMEGIPMLKLGLGYIIAGIFGQGSEYIIRAMMIRFGELSDVGLYNSGYMMVVACTSVVFIAIEADYFPRLTAAKLDLARQNFTINQQVEVCVLLIAPCLILLVVAMPLIVQVLYSRDFVQVVPMATCASIFMFFKALTLPVSYLSLAHGDSKMYMTTELLYDIFIAIAIPLAYVWFGLTGTGVALSIAGVFDMVMIHTIYRRRYNYRFSFRLFHFYVIQFVLLATVIYTAFMPDNIPFMSGVLLRWIINVSALLLSAFFSLRILGRKTVLLSKLKRRVFSGKK